MSNRIELIQGTTVALAIDLVDTNGNSIAMADLVDAVATFTMRVQPTDSSNVLAYATATTPANLSFDQAAPVLYLTFLPGDSSGIAIAPYFYLVQVTTKAADVYDVIPWSPIDVTLGGSATPTPPAFDNTVKITADYQMPGLLQYVTPGGSPIVGAQVRVYKKSDYDAGNLDIAVGMTTTDASGKWQNPILVVTGYTYVARFELPYQYGPDVKEFFA